MIQPDEFDAFYKRARTRLLLQTYALTGDLPASRSAVRDAFVMTWHHWRKVSRLPDPESWVRPRAWSQAHRRHSARIWHRDKLLDADSRATLAALAKLSYAHRRALVLEQLTDLPADERARELGVTRADGDRQLEAARQKFLGHREVEAEQLPRLFGAMEAQAAEAAWPRSSIIRRSGASRRRVHTLLGVVVAVLTLLVSGTAVSSVPDDPEDEDTPAASPTGRRPLATTAFNADRLLGAEAVSLVVGGRGWRESATSDNSGGDGLAIPCQRSRYADPEGLAALVRTFDTRPRPREPEVAAVQVAELSRDVESAEETWRTAVQWYAGCTAPRVQLRGAYRVREVGHEAMLFHLRSWADPVSHYLIGVARTGEVTTTTFARTTATDAGVRTGARLLGEAVEQLCGSTEGARCLATQPTIRPVPPPPVSETPGVLIAADLPPAGEIRRPWVGTEPRQARDNAAATRCDSADFSGKGMSNAITRTFLIPNTRLPAAFGLTETVGTMPQGKARDFVAGVRDRMASCSDRDPGSEVQSLRQSSGAERELAIWRVTSEVGDDQTVTYWMGITRVGTAIAQVGFVPGPGAGMDPAAFEALVRRAAERLAYMPRPRR